jgi:quercetin dioxygenase-like cupin family protein
MRLRIVIACFTLCTLAAFGQDPVKVDAKHTKVEYENDQVRILRFHLGPHESSPMHSHPDRFFVFLNDGHTRVTENGKVEERHAKRGDTATRPASSHAVENLADTDYETIIVEFKQKQNAISGKK